MAKKIEFDIAARDGIKHSVDALANAVKVTLVQDAMSSSVKLWRSTRDQGRGDSGKKIELETPLKTWGHKW